MNVQVIPLAQPFIQAIGGLLRWKSSAMAQQQKMQLIESTLAIRGFRRWEVIANKVLYASCGSHDDRLERQPFFKSQNQKYMPETLMVMTPKKEMYLKMLDFIEKSGYDPEGITYSFQSALSVLKLVDQELETQGYTEVHHSRYELVKLIEEAEEIN